MIKHSVFVWILCRHWPLPPVLPYLLKFRHFGKIFSLGQFLEELFGKIFKKLWQILNAIGQIFVEVKGPMLTNNLVTLLATSFTLPQIPCYVYMCLGLPKQFWKVTSLSPSARRIIFHIALLSTSLLEKVDWKIKQ